MIATWEDAKAIGYCGKGMRQWVAEKDRGVTYLEFVRDGVSVEWLRAQDDAMADRLADYAERSK